MTLPRRIDLAVGFLQTEGLSPATAYRMAELCEDEENHELHFRRAGVDTLGSVSHVGGGAVQIDPCDVTIRLTVSGDGFSKGELLKASHGAAGELIASGQAELLDAEQQQRILKGIEGIDRTCRRLYWLKCSCRRCNLQRSRRLRARIAATRALSSSPASGPIALYRDEANPMCCPSCLNFLEVGAPDPDGTMPPRQCRCGALVRPPAAFSPNRLDP